MASPTKLPQPFPATGLSSRGTDSSHDMDARVEINVRGVIALRWVAVSGQLLTVLVVQWLLGVQLPWHWLFAVLGATAALNAGLMIAHRLSPRYWPRITSHHWQQVLGLTMLFDLAALTLLLHLTGGVSNPFCLFYFVNIVLAAILLPRAWVWSLVLVSVICFVSLNIWYWPLAELATSQAVDGFLSLGISVSRLGLFVAYATCSSVIVLFIKRIRGQIELLEENVRQLAQAKARSDRLDSLGTLAAGAAHELASPLSTIAIITKEVETELTNGAVTPQTLADIATIRTELDRCRDILDRMSSDAGLVIGEGISTTTLGELISECSSGVDPRASINLIFDPAIASVPLRVPLEGLAQAVRAIVKNAIDASGHPQHVSMHATLQASMVTLKVKDQGTGIDPEMLNRIGEPFFTTKEPGKGMGLGVYLARNVIERLGGTITYDSQPGQGTVVSITLPREFSRDLLDTPEPVRRSFGLF